MSSNALCQMGMPQLGKRPRNAVIAVNQVRGQLTVMKHVLALESNAPWDCLCSCGEMCRVRSNELLTGAVWCCITCLLKSLKKCNECKADKPRDREHFPPHARARDKLESVCLECLGQRAGYKRCPLCPDSKPATLEFFSRNTKKKGGLQSRCKEHENNRPKPTRRAPRGRCTLCERMPWRVEGQACRKCGLEAGEECA